MPAQSPTLLSNSLLAQTAPTQNYQFMVKRAADEKLDGYRELGQRAAKSRDPGRSR